MNNLTLLLDLDDTLLATHMENFLPAYFQALSAALADYVPPERMLPVLMQAVQAMMTNRDPALTLQEVFDAHFFLPLGLERALVQPAIDDFYAHDFPKLQALTNTIAEAHDFLDWAFQQGYRVAIATNPLFPRVAIDWRLRWAGFPPEDWPFALISSYETFHFTKDSALYYTELMARLGWPDGPVVMVGDDEMLDKRTALAAGLPFFWIGNPQRPQAQLLGGGSLDDLRRLLASVTSQTLLPHYETPADYQAILTATPAALAARLDGEQSFDAESEILGLALDWWLTAERTVVWPALERLTQPSAADWPVDWEIWQYAPVRPEAVLSLWADFLSVRRRTLTLLAALPADIWTYPLRRAAAETSTLGDLMRWLSAYDRHWLRQIHAA